MAPTPTATTAISSLLTRRARRAQKDSEPAKHTHTPSKVTKAQSKPKKAKGGKQEVVVKKKEDGLSTVERNLRKIGVTDRGLGRKEGGDVRVKVLEMKSAKKKVTKEGGKKEKKGSGGFVFASDDDDSDSD